MALTAEELAEIAREAAGPDADDATVRRLVGKVRPGAEVRTKAETRSEAAPKAAPKATPPGPRSSPSVDAMAPPMTMDDTRIDGTPPARPAYATRAVQLDTGRPDTGRPAPPSDTGAVSRFVSDIYDPAALERVQRERAMEKLRTETPVAARGEAVAPVAVPRQPPPSNNPQKDALRSELAALIQSGKTDAATAERRAALAKQIRAFDIAEAER